MRSAIHALKYDRLLPAARQLGNLLARAISLLADTAPRQMLVIPVPLHRAKHAQRGFNQAHSLAAYALESLHKTHPHWHLTLAPTALTRQRPTDSQAGLTTRQRRLNVRGAFVLSTPAAVTQQDILLVDDIYTTGSTVRAAAGALLRAGAASVWVATLARAHRVSPIGPGSPVVFEDADDNSNQAGIAPVLTPRQVSHPTFAQGSYQESLLSSQDQPSF
jgi:ComF family protein